MPGYNNEEYVAKLRERNALAFIEDCRVTLAEVEHTFSMPQGMDETLRQYQDRLSRARSDIERLRLRIQDGNTR